MPKIRQLDSTTPIFMKKANPLKGSRIPTSSDPAAESAYAAARELCRRQFKDVFFAAAFLPVAKRRAVYSIVGFCKIAADALAPQSATATESHPASVAGSCSSGALDQTMSLLTHRLDDIYEHRLDLPLPEFRDPTQHILYAFSKNAQRYSIPKQLFLDFAQG